MSNNNKTIEQFGQFELTAEKQAAVKGGETPGPQAAVVKGAKGNVVTVTPAHTTKRTR